MRYFVSGCAGFIGSHLVDRLLMQGHQVTGHDNFLLVNRGFLNPRGLDWFSVGRG